MLINQVFAVLLPEIYISMLDRIASSRQNNLPDEEKIEMKVSILNQLTAKQRYSFERVLKRSSEPQAHRNSQNQIKKTGKLSSKTS